MLSSHVHDSSYGIVHATHRSRQELNIKTPRPMVCAFTTFLSVSISDCLTLFPVDLTYSTLVSHSPTCDFRFFQYADGATSGVCMPHTFGNTRSLARGHSGSCSRLTGRALMYEDHNLIETTTTVTVACTAPNFTPSIAYLSIR
jgi:hypothetical protein